MDSLSRNFAGVPISVTDPSAPKGIDLGLSVKWAEFNVGATKAQEYGGYYAWAMNFDADMVIRYYISRCYGHSVRAVSE